MPPQESNKRTAQLSIRVVTNAGRNACAGLMDDGVTWKIRIAAPAIDGRANAGLIAHLAGLLDVPRGAVTLTAGAASRSKRIRIDGMSTEAACARLAAAAAEK